MRLSFPPPLLLVPSQNPNLTTRPTWWAHMDPNKPHRRRKDRPHHIAAAEKVLVIVGPTGSGKSRLSVDLGRILAAEIINSDKIQIHRGLDITTNKITMRERLGVPHHLLGEFDPDSDITPADSRSIAASTISNIAARRKLPILVGGSNSFIHALLAKRFHPGTDVFGETGAVSPELRYRCCFLWVDVSLPVLNQYLSKRVDEMLNSGMFEELAEYFDKEGSETAVRTGLRKAIGVPEFEKYFRSFRRRGGGGRSEEEMYEEAVRAIKENTWQLAKRQREKIVRLREAGWDLRRLEATEVFKAAMGLGNGSDIWEREVMEPSMKIVKRFLEDE